MCHHCKVLANQTTVDFDLLTNLGTYLTVCVDVFSLVVSALVVEIQPLKVELFWASNNFRGYWVWLNTDFCVKETLLVTKDPS